MKGNPIQLLKGPTLRSQIYNSLSHQKLANTTRLLRHTLKNHLKHSDYDSQVTEMKTQMCSPAPKTENSIQKISKSVNQSWTSRRGKKKSSSRSKDKLFIKTDFKKQSKNEKSKSKSQILPKSKVQVQKNKVVHKKTASKDKNKHKSNVKQCPKVNLESIIQQSSSDQQLITPQHKNKMAKIDKSLNSLSNSRTKKKQKPQLFSESVRRKIEKSFKEPQAFQKLLKLPELTISFRIIKRRLIQVQLYTHKAIQLLQVSLSKGNLECQNIQQQYSHVSSNTILALFSSVRNIDLDHLLDFPKIELSAEFGEEKLERSVILPYTWLHYTEEHQPTLKKSKIKTKLCLSDIPINSHNLNLFGQIFHSWFKRVNKGHAEFSATFNIGQQDCTLKLLEQSHQKFTIQLEGKGEARLMSMIEFFQRLVS